MRIDLSLVGGVNINLAVVPMNLVAASGERTKEATNPFAVSKCMSEHLALKRPTPVTTRARQENVHVNVLANSFSLPFSLGLVLNNSKNNNCSVDFRRKLSQVNWG